MFPTLNVPAWQVRCALVRALAEQLADAPEVWPRLLGAAADPDPAVREAAVEALAGWHSPEQAESALPVFCERALDGDEAVRRVAVEALGRFGEMLSAKVVEGALAGALRDESEEVRAAAAHALGRFDGTSMGALRRSIQDPDRAVRREAIRALGRHAHPDAVPDLLAAADPKAAGEALAHLGRRFPEIEAALVIGWGRCGPQLRHVLAQALAGMRSAAALDQLRRWLKHPRRHWRWRALSLVELFLPLDPTLAAECVTALDDSHVRVRLATLRVMPSLGRAALPAVPRLIRRRFDGDRRSRDLAALALAYLAEYCSPLDGGLLRRLASQCARPGDVVHEVAGQAGWPAAVRAEVQAACERRRRWHAMHGRAPGEEGNDAEYAWQLALLWTRTFPE